MWSLWLNVAPTHLCQQLVLHWKVPDINVRTQRQKEWGAFRGWWCSQLPFSPKSLTASARVQTSSLWFSECCFQPGSLNQGLLQRDLLAKVLGICPAAKSSAIRGVHRPLSLITVSRAGCCSSQTLPAFTVAELLGAFSKFFPFLDAGVLLVLLTSLHLSSGESWNT